MIFSSNFPGLDVADAICQPVDRFLALSVEQMTRMITEPEFEDFFDLQSHILPLLHEHWEVPRHPGVDFMLCEQLKTSLISVTNQLMKNKVAENLITEVLRYAMAIRVLKVMEPFQRRNQPVPAGKGPYRSE